MEVKKINLKKSELLNLYFVLGNCKYSKKPSALALAFVKIKEEFNKYREQQIELSKHLGGENVERYKKAIEDEKNGHEVSVSLSLEANKFEKDLSESLEQILKEEVTLSIPEIDVDVLVEDNNLTASAGACLYETLKY